MKLALAAVSLILVVGGAAGCGDDKGSDSGSGGGSSDDAVSTDDFCGAFKDFTDALGGIDPDDTSGIIKKLKAEAGKLSDVGTPDGIPDDAKQGEQVVLDAIDDLPDDATLEDLSGLEQGFSKDDEANAKAFDAYLAKTCPELGGDEPSASTATLPSSPVS